MGWSGSKKRHGYGRVWIDYVEHIASRLSWAVHNSADPGEASVCHRCDNPECANPEHLFLGTHAENIQDAANKGKRMGFGARPQHNRGSANPMARLSEDDIAEIKKARGAGLTYRQSGERFGIHPGYAERIVNGSRRRQPEHYGNRE